MINLFFVPYIERIHSILQDFDALEWLIYGLCKVFNGVEFKVILSIKGKNKGLIDWTAAEI